MSDPCLGILVLPFEGSVQCSAPARSSKSKIDRLDITAWRCVQVWQVSSIATATAIRSLLYRWVAPRERLSRPIIDANF